MIKNVFYFILEARFVLNMFKFLSWFHVEKIIFKVYDVSTWLTNNCDTDIAQYHKVKATEQCSLVS